MKGFVIFLFLILFSTSFAFAQMSDDQVVNYVKSEAEKGTSRQVIATELMKRGVTQSQLERLKSQAEQQKSISSTSSAVSVDPIVRTAGLNETVAINQQTDDSGVFGRNIFNQKNLTFTPNVNIPTPENYKLGPGDEVVIDIWGVYQASVRQTISPEGSITVDRLGPVYLNGMTIKEANAYIKQKFVSLYSGIGEGEGASQIKLTLGQIRTIQINIMGEIEVPGTYAISSLASVFHALYNAGGINKLGSLRTVQLYRKGKLIETVDIYKYLLNGDFSSDIRLSDGDVIIVPPYVSLVGISGRVKRPMVYEMTSQETLEDLIRYAGGFTSDAYTDKINLTRKTGGYNKIFTLNEANYKKFELSDGDIISVSSGLDQFENRVEIRGAVFRPGGYEIGNEIKTIKDLVKKAGGVRENAFLDRAILTREKEDLTLENISFNLDDLLKDKLNDVLLKKNDVVQISSKDVILDLGGFSIHGHVTSPGVYTYADNTTIEDLIVKAGGLRGSASMAKVDVSRRVIDPLGVEAPTTIAETFTFDLKNGLISDGQSGFILKPYDQVYVRKSPGYIEQRNVTIQGEVLFPGQYVLTEKNERLSDIVTRSGNLTPYAYTRGARLIRPLSDEELARQRKSLTTISERNISDSISSELSEIDRFYSIGIELDKAIQNPKSDYDLVLKAGDRLVIPEYDNTIKINGAVMYPNTVLYKKGKKVSHYIEQAGGFSDLAEKKRVFVVHMNGTVEKAKGSSKDAVQPGCTIIVPSKERKDKLSLPEVLSLGTSMTSMASVVALLINALTK